MIAPGIQQVTTQAPDKIERLVKRWHPAGLLPMLLPMLLYMATLAPTIYNLDSAELTTAVATGGIIRATGYPLYLVLGRAWTLLPVGDVGYRMNLLSAMCGALTILLADRILRRLNVGPWARLGALGLLATAPYFWGLSLIAEVYTLHTALMAGVILALLRWGERPTPGRVALPVFLMTLSMGNHAATILLVPACIWTVLVTQPAVLRQPRTWLAGGLAGLAGASVFLYLPLVYAAQPTFNYAGAFDAAGVFHPVNLHTVDGLLWLITGRTFAGQMFGYGWPEAGPEFASYGRQLFTAFLAVGIGPAVVGLLHLGRRDWRVSGMFVLMFATNAIFYINYRVVDKDTMFLPTYLIWALWLGVGYQLLLDWLRTGREAQRAVWLLRGVMVLAVLAALVWNWSRVDLSSDYSTRQQSAEILRLAEPDAIVLGWWETVPGVQYLQLVEGIRPDVLAINRFLISGDDMLALIKSQAGQRPIYINNPPLELIQTMDVTQVGSLYRLEPRR